MFVYLEITHKLNEEVNVRAVFCKLDASGTKRVKTPTDKMELQISTDYSDVKFSSNYNLASCENLYVSKLVSINESIIDAA